MTDEEAKALAADILQGLDLSEFDDLEPDIAASIMTALKGAGAEILGELGVPDGSDPFDVVDQSAGEFSQEHAAELVTSISEATREFMRADIENALKEGSSVNEIQADIEDNYGFSPERALTIARTETAIAHNQGALEGAKAAGFEYKQWELGSEHDGSTSDPDECDDAAEAGPIPIEDSFPDGSDAPPAHPNCSCSVTYVSAEDFEGAEDA